MEILNPNPIHIRHMFCHKCQRSTPHHIQKKTDYNCTVAVKFSCVIHTATENKLVHEAEVPKNEYYLLMADQNRLYKPGTSVP